MPTVLIPGLILLCRTRQFFCSSARNRRQ